LFALLVVVLQSIIAVMCVLCRVLADVDQLRDSLEYRSEQVYPHALNYSGIPFL